MSVKEVLYTAHGHATGGRAGRGASSDNKVDVTLSVPKSMGGDDGPGTNPEQLFSVGYSACFLGALKFAAGKEGVKLPDDSKVSAEIGIGPREDGGGFGITAALTITAPGVEKAVLEDLVQKAHIVCPYSNAIYKSVDVKLSVA
ncbi:organic hydroperoxide resistance protein [Acidocella aminolytica]|jgi:Ohr subfamily peroxiredoxin|uniref:Osmotically inducible peroxiredoxin OsmC n=1 Tax=Acidocella aminolytica 101 = DSM 11237 TaxID=1120923 RepID=A0A0D6PCQ1_9PROT|nr:organic hydroperoxide resistance protein [Acidocella aminolytica]GAN78998.1 osmotically inducible peroxiredoxin OsmC [Acidocella aminolytica 101 = DSM 11237]GBQ38372.1 organic hydroperoxide resistance protein [Acidocella aminolytica 101 = DSM 11237]SHF37422.1 peroxiredoxin, Ohr subfamily [Acidocella aminolytica 101 = DSM 11237]